MKKTFMLIVFICVLASGIALDLLPITVPDGIDKLYHFLGFSLLTALSIKTFIVFFGKKNINKFFFFLLTFGGVFAAVSEGVQSFLSLRSCDVYDWLTNLFAIAFVVLIAYINISKENLIEEALNSRFDKRDLLAFS